MCSCSTLGDHQDRSCYVRPSAGDDVVRFGDDSRVGLLYHLDAYAGGLPRAHVVYDDGSEDCACLFVFQSPAHAGDDPCWE
jgi:hypothetical protein